MDVQICILPGGVDPADLLAKDNGAQEFEQVISHSTDVLEYVLQRFEQELQIRQGLSGQQALIERFLGELHRLGLASVHGVRRTLLLGKLAELLGLPLPNVESLLAGLGRDNQPPITNDQRQDDVMLLPDEEHIQLPEHRRKAEQHYLALLVHDPTIHEGAELIGAEQFADPTHRALAELVLPRLAKEARRRQPQRPGEPPRASRGASGALLIVKGAKRSLSDASPFPARTLEFRSDKIAKISEIATNVF